MAEERGEPALRPRLHSASLVSSKSTPRRVHASAARRRTSSILEDSEVILTFDDVVPSARCTRARYSRRSTRTAPRPSSSSSAAWRWPTRIMVREYDRRGHTVGTHAPGRTPSSPSSRRSRRAQEIEHSGSAQYSSPWGKPIAPFFRFPYLAEARSMLAARPGTSLRQLRHRHRQQGLSRPRAERAGAQGHLRPRRRKKASSSFTTSRR